MPQPYLRILPTVGFDLFLSADGGGEYYTAYHFVYEQNPANPSLDYAEGPNDPANRSFYRIKTAHLVRREGDRFTELFHALQGGEIGLALREEGAGDFVGGLHGDEVLTEALLTANGAPLPLDREFSGEIECFTFHERSTVYRCNTPSVPILHHTQTYTSIGNRLCLAQSVEWIADALPLEAAYMPMLTAPRREVGRPELVLTDTVEFLSNGGELIRSFDTSAYGSTDEGLPSNVCRDTHATAVRVFGKLSGFCAEAGLHPVEGISPEDITARLWIRYGGALDNKIYFEISGKKTPRVGTHWACDVYYRITYLPPNGTTEEQEKGSRYE